MKEILFRGKRVDNGEWVYGYYVKPTHHWHEHGIHDDWIIRTAFQNGGYFNVVERYAVVPETVGQFTGLTDKYGKKIFEGDIIRYCDEDYCYYYEDCTEFFGEVVQEYGAFGVGTQNELPLEFENWCSNDNFVSLWEIYWNLNCSYDGLPMIEIIGNIYDNKGLIGK